MLKPVAWHFTTSELIICRDVYFKKIIARELITEIFVSQIIYEFSVNDYEIKYWIMLKVPADEFEEGKLHLLIIQGTNTAISRSSAEGLDPTSSGAPDVFRLTKLIAAHWNIPLNA